MVLLKRNDTHALDSAGRYQENANDISSTVNIVIL